MTSPLLRVSDLGVRLSGNQVLRDVNLTINSGEFIGVIGPNGAGKTTFLRAILGLINTSSGRVQFSAAGNTAKPGKQAKLGATPAKPGRRELARLIGYVPQRHEFAWEFPITVEDAVLTGLIAEIGILRRPGAAHYQAVTEALTKTGLLELRKRPVGALSGGQRQRVLVARALVCKPKMLLLDEPFTGVDMPTAEELTQLFKNLAAAGCAVVMTTHDLLSAVHECSRICLINRTVVADGTPAQLLQGDAWQRAFNVSSSHPLLRAIGAVSAAKTPSEIGAVSA